VGIEKGRRKSSRIRAPDEARKSDRKAPDRGHTAKDLAEYREAVGVIFQVTPRSPVEIKGGTMKKVDKYVYPAVFTYEEGYEIAVTFPDLPGCATSGTDEIDALAMAREALGCHLWCMEIDDDEIPAPTELLHVAIEENERVVLVDVYMPAIRLAEQNKSINRTVTLPAWLNAAALERKVNFSQVLQEALIEKMQIQRA